MSDTRKTEAQLIEEVAQLRQRVAAMEKTEAALRESEELYRMTLHNITDPVFVTDDAGDWVFVCPNFQTLFGYSYEEIKDMGNIKKLLGSNLVAPDALYTQGEMTTIERKIKNKAGQSRTVLVHVKRVSIQGGTVLYTCHDITERKQTEQALRENEERLRRAESMAHVGHYEIDIATGKAHWSDEIFRIFGRSPEVGEPSVKEYSYLIHEEDRESLNGLFAECIRTGNTFDMVYRILRPDGEVRYVYSIGLVGSGSDGQTKMFGTIQDVTERKLTEEALRESEKRYRMTLDSMADAIHTVDSHLRITMVNPATMQWLKVIGLAADTVRQNLFTMCPFLPEQVRDEYQQVFDTGQILITEEINQIGNREVVTETRKIPIFEREQVSQVLTVIRDITERKQLEQHGLELALEKERGETFRTLISNIAHDLKTPLAIINTSVYLLEKHTDPAKRQQKIDNIKRQAHLLDSFIQDLLAIARFDTDPELRLTLVDVNELVMRIEADHHSIIEQKQLTFTLDLEETLPPIQADQTDLHRAFANLVENAINYTPEAHSVTLRTSCQGSVVLVEVVDTGIGIREDTLPLIFNRFYRAPEAQAITDNGSGLGLAIVKRVIEMHNGTMEVKSVPGKGTSFRVLLPILNS